MGHEAHWSEDGELYIRKSMIESFLLCPRKFYLEWIEERKQHANLMMLQGTRFHEFAYKFFDIADAVDVDEWECMIPGEFNDHEKRMARWFIQYERQRLHECMVKGKEDEWRPFMREHRMVDDERHLESTFDRIDWWDKEKRELIIVEYKTGSKINEASVKRQLAFYIFLWYSTGCVGKITMMRVINPNIGEVRDFEVEERDVKKTLNNVLKIRDAIALDDFPPKCSEAKFAMCKMCGLDDSELYHKDRMMSRFADMIVETTRFVDAYECE